MSTYRLSSLIIHFNNPVTLKKTLDRMVAVGLVCGDITVLDNCSETEKSADARLICKDRSVHFIQSDINRGWGAAINYFIDTKSWSDKDLLLISAHDAWIEKFTEENAVKCFDDPQVAFICPQYPEPLIAEFTLSRSFKCRPLAADESDNIQTLVGHATLCIARPGIIKMLRFDEEYFIYGCESEIFLRCADRGLRTIIMGDFVVSNPDTDSSTEFVTRAFAINSIYTAKKRAGYFGFILRIVVVLISAVRLFVRGQASQAQVKLSAVLWTIKTGGKGLRSFLKIKDKC